MAMLRTAASWRQRPVSDTVAADVAAFAKMPLPVARAVAARGICARDTLQQYLSGSLPEVSDPFSWPGMDAAVDRIWRAIDAHEPISVFGDYDADGVTSCALMLRVLQTLGADVTFYLPCRFEDGFGLRPASIRRCIAAGQPGLIITVDCGSSGHEAINLAQAQGIDVVVTDHHRPPPEGLPPACAVINPAAQGCCTAAPPAGVGVAFKLCHGLVKRGRQQKRSLAIKLDLRRHLGLVALGTVADVVPLLGENRILVKAALKNFPLPDEWGLRALAALAGLREITTAEQLAFGLAPRINAGGRLAHAVKALDLLLASDPDEAGVAAAELQRLNEQRRGIEKTILQKARADISERYGAGDGYGLVTGGVGWHQGVIGIVAARLSSEYYRPAAVVAIDENGAGHGSARGIPGINLVDVLKECSDLLTNYGGHTAAAGFSLPREALPAFTERFNDVCRDRIDPADLSPVVEFDGWLGLDAVNDELLTALDRMEPFGEKNESPLFGVQGLIVRDFRYMGANQQHARWCFCDEESGLQCPAVMFNLAGRKPVGRIDALVNVVRNTFRGRTTIEFRVQDIRQSVEK